MVIRFNWFMYSVFIGCLRRGALVRGSLQADEPGGTWNVDTVKSQNRIKAPGYMPAMVRCGSLREQSEVNGFQGMRGSAGAWKGLSDAGRIRRGDGGMSEVKKKGNPVERKGKQWQDDQLLRNLAQTAITELRPRILAAGIKKQRKQDLLLSLLHLLKSYTALTVLQAYPFRVAINNFIEKETASRCSIHLNNEELLALWRDVR
jgi:hypothetical protein